LPLYVLLSPVIPAAFLIIPSYVSTILGIVMLFMVTVDFYNSNSTVSKMLYFVLIAVFISIIATIPVNLHLHRKKAKEKARTCLSISVVSFIILVIGASIIFTVPRFYVNVIVSYLVVASIFAILGSFIVGMVSLSIATFIQYKERKLKKEAETTVPYLDEGSGV
jgi:uncharacterized membrane protein YhaH (DUF805 family)